LLVSPVTAQPLEPVLAQARTQKGPLLDTLKELVSIESGSRDLEGLERIAQLVAGRLKQLGGEVELVTVLINADEELSSPGSRSLLTRLGAEHDATLSFEASRVESDKIALATAGIASVALKVYGKASHAGSAPQLGVNALYELSHQILQTRDLSNPATGLKMNWTMSRAGMSRNVIPPAAEAMADVRVLRVADYDGIEQAVRQRIKKQLVPEARVEMIFERRRPPLEASPASAAMAKHAQAIYKELGQPLLADAVAEGGGTDAAFAALKTRNAVVERFGLRGFGAHSTDDEYVLVSSIEPRLYLAARLIMDVARDRIR
jgi:glutamate carboxypeptidase